MRKLILPLKRFELLLVMVCIIVATLLFLPGRAYFAKGQWALLYLLIISLVAGLSGIRAAVLASVLAFLAWDFFFLPPYNTFWIVDPKDWLALLVFLVVGMTIGIQTGRMHEREAQAIARERETALLNDISSSLVSTTQTRIMAEILLQEITRFSGARAVTLWLPDAVGQLTILYRVAIASYADDPQSPQLANWAFRNSKAIGLPTMLLPGGIRIKRWPISVSHDTCHELIGQMDTGAAVPRNAGVVTSATVKTEAEYHDLYLPLQTATAIEGVLQIAPSSSSLDYRMDEAHLFVSSANLAAVFLERQRLQIIAAKAEMLQEVDTLKTTLVSSVSHELKSPLAAITATVTNLLTDDVEWTVPRMREQLFAVEGNLERLHGNIGALLDFARLESQDWKPQFEWYDLAEVIEIVLDKLQEAERERIVLQIPDDFPFLQVDCRQLARALQHLLENALVYAPADTKISFNAQATEREICLAVEDSGPGIPDAEKQMIFEKFYRGAATSNLPQGTGLGLAIAAEIVRFHHGRMWVEDVYPHGARFIIALPKSQPQ